MSHRCKHIHQHREGPAIQHFRWQKTPTMSRSSRQWSPTWAHCSSPVAFSCLAHCYSFLKESNVRNSFSLIIKWLVAEILRLPFSCYSVRLAPVSAHKRGITGIWGKQGLGYISVCWWSGGDLGYWEGRMCTSLLLPLQKLCLHHLHPIQDLASLGISLNIKTSNRILGGQLITIMSFHCKNITMH